MSVLPGRLAPIAAGRLRGGILSAAQPLPATYDQWRGGVTFNPLCLADETRLWYCTEVEAVPADQPLKNADGVSAPVTFNPFLTYAEADCSPWGLSHEELLSRARIGFDRTLSAGVATQLQSNPLGTASPSLNSVGTEIAGSGTADIVNTLSALITQYTCECRGTDLIIHAPVRAVPFFVERELIEWDASRGLWHMGPYDFSFDCYSETGPGAVSTPVDGSEVWLYATGRVEYDLGPQVDTTDRDSHILRTNERVELTEGLAILRFDPCCVLAARAQVF